MKKVGTYFLIFALVVGGGLAVFWPSNHFRIYDANLQPLAMTELEAVCTGEIGINSGFKPQDPDVKACREERVDDLTNEPNIARTEEWTCVGIIAGGWGGDMVQCLTILSSYDLWPLLEGGLTYEWNAAHPRPSSTESIIDNPTRSIDRAIENRGEEG